MPPALLSMHEAERLAPLHSIDILDTPAKDIFECFVAIACGVFGVPTGLIALLDRNRQWFKVIAGFAASEMPREAAFCAHAIRHPHDVLCVPDAKADPRFAGLPSVVGRPFVRFFAGVPLLDPEGQPLGVLCAVDTRPLAPSPAALAQLRQLATGVSAALRLHDASRRLIDEARHDPLTGLPNRREFDATLRTLGRRAVTLFMLDLDNFKAVNDAFGHAGADEALREVARRLGGMSRGWGGDRVFRLGGDAFAVLTDGPHDPAAAMARAAAIHAALLPAFMLDQQVLSLRASIGVGAVPAHAKTAANLVSAADAALYAAKRQGRGATRMAQTTRRRGAASGDLGMGRLTMRDTLRAALLTPRFEQFRLHFQPVLDLAHGRATTQEALVRWTLPDGRQIGPADFVPVAEECGLISHLDRWVLDQACAAAVRWPVSWIASVNISPFTITLLDVVGLVRDALRRTGLPPEQLLIEVTETAPVTDPDRMMRTVKGLLALGVAPVVDDFGTGNASLAFLRRYPFERVKADRSFVAGLGTDPRAMPVMEAMVGLLRSLDTLLVVEGVETEDQLAILHRLGVRRVQGFLLGRPVPGERIAQNSERAERKLARILRRHGLHAGPPAAAPARRRIRPAAAATPDWAPDPASRETVVA
jgi:diguanylate cyclase (GGDEF)-like protein